MAVFNKITELKVLNQDYYKKSYAHFSFISPDFGKDMNINGGYGGTPEHIYDADSTQWTLVNVSNSDVENRTELYYDGAASLRWKNMDNGDIIRFDKGSSFSLSGYSYLTFWIYVKKQNDDGNSSFSIYGYDGSQVGDKVYLQSYISLSTYNEWQRVEIPLSDMSLESSSITGLCFKKEGGTGGDAEFYIDNLDFQQDQPQNTTFTATPYPYGDCYIERIKFLIQAPYDSTLTNASMPKINFEAFLSLSELPSGCYLSYVSGGVERPISTLKRISDFVGVPNSKIIDYGYSGTYTFISTENKFDTPLKLVYADGDCLKLRIRDNLSTLFKFKILATGYMISGVNSF